MERVFAELTSDKPIAIIGQYGSGKTHLLRIVESVFTHIEELQNYRVIYINASRESNLLEVLIRELLILIAHFNLNINVNLGNSTLQNQFGLIIKEIMKFMHNFKILFLIDEFELYLRNNDFLDDIFFLSEIIYRNNGIKLIIASSDFLSDGLRDRFTSIPL